MGIFHSPHPGLCGCGRDRNIYPGVRRMIALLNHTGTMDAGIGVLLKRFSGNTLIIILMAVFALMGSVYGAWEELPAYAVIVIPLFVSAGYDAVTGMMVILIGATVGNMASIVNPYSIGAAVAAIGNPDLSLGSGDTIEDDTLCGDAGGGYPDGTALCIESKKAPESSPGKRSRKCSQHQRKCRRYAYDKKTKNGRWQSLSL